MKKLTSVILSVLMVVSLFSCVFTGTTVSAEQTATNLIVNGDFESFNVNTEGNKKVPAFAWRNVKTILGTDKTNGQWYRTTGGIGPEASPDLDADYKVITGTTTYPTYFGPNNQMVIEPTESGDSTNRVLRAVQDLNTQIEVKNNGEYSLSFRFKLPQSDTGLTFFGLFLITPNQNSDSLSQTLNSFKEPYNITNATLDPSGTDSGITINSNNKITFSGTSTEWQNVKVIFNVKRNDEVAIPVYTEDEVNYTFPVLMKIGFDTESAETSKGYAEHITDSSIKNKDSYRKKCIYFDDFVMNEVVNCVGAAEFYDVNGNPLPDEQAYTKVTTTVNNTETSTIYSGDEVTATVAEYDKTSGAYTFLGWYKGDEKVTKGLSDDGMSVTFTAAVDETYTPHFGSANLLGGSGSFENYENSESLAVALPTGISSVNDITADNIPNYSGNNKWATNENAGYLGATWPETIYDKDGNNYQQVATYKKIRLLNTFNVEDATIAKSGSKYLHINGGGASSLGLENLNKNTDYKLSFYLRYSDVNANKIKSVGVTTTVNINNDQCNKDATLNSQGMLITLENAVPSHKITVAKCDSTELSKVSTTEWQKITVDFNSGNLEKLYLAIVSNGGKPLDYYIDDMVLVKAGDANSVSAANVEFHDANGDAVDSSNEYAKADIIGNFDGTYTAKVAYDKESGAYAFDGWYYNGAIIEGAGETFDFDINTYTDLTKLKAVITSANLLPEAASFESYKSQKTLTYADSEKVGGVFPAPTSTKWGTATAGKYFDDNHFKIHTVYGQYEVPCYNKDTNTYVKKSFNAHSGNSMLRINTHSRSAIRALENLTPNTDYTLTFYVLGTSEKDYISCVAVAYRYDNYAAHKATASTEGTIAIQSLSYSADWQKVTLSFNSGSYPKLYLHMCQTAKAGIASQGGSFVDDLSLIAMPKVDVQFVDVKGNDITSSCANEAKPNITNSTTKPGYFVATANYESDAFEFKGWYNGDTLLSTDKSFEFVSGAYTTLTAKVVSRNILSEAASFEGYTNPTTLTYTAADANEEGDYPEPTSKKWGTSTEGTYFKDNHFQIHTVYGQYEVPCYNKDTDTYEKKSFNAHSGNAMLRINTHSRSAIRALENLTPNTDYTLTFYVLGTSEKDYISCVAVAYRYDNYAAHKATASTEGTIAIQSLSYSADWQKVTLSFNSGSYPKLYLHMCQTAKATKGTEGGSFIDDLTCYATNLTAADLGIDEATDIVYKGASIRKYANAQKPQALRHKFEIKKSLIDDGNTLYGDLVEYGSVAIRTDYLGTRELVKDGVYNYQDRERKAVTGIAYQKGTIDKVFADTGDTKIFTAALTGIGKKAGAETLDYSLFAKEYAVRNYLIFEDANGNRTTVYTTTRSVSVFNVMKCIIDKYTANSELANDTLKNDYNTIQSIFNSDAGQKTAYEAWVKANQSAE